MLDKLRSLNPGIRIDSIDDDSFKQYGRVIKGVDFSDLSPTAMESMTTEGKTYIADIDDFKQFDSFKNLVSEFGRVEIQAGICFGQNVLMNGMEYHKSSEIIIAVTDMILILGDVRDIVNNRWDSSNAVCYYLTEGSAVELYAGTLHLAPTRVTDKPFCSIIVLPKGTNAPLTREAYDDELLFMENKWLICHPDSPAVSRGGVIGITGDNIKISTI